MPKVVIKSKLIHRYHSSGTEPTIDEQTEFDLPEDCGTLNIQVQPFHDCATPFLAVASVSYEISESHDTPAVAECAKWREHALELLGIVDGSFDHMTDEALRAAVRDALVT